MNLKEINKLKQLLGKPLPMSTDNTNYELSMGNQILKIHNVNSTIDSGFYSCTAENNIDKISESARLYIRPGSKISLIFYFQN